MSAEVVPRFETFLFDMDGNKRVSEVVEHILVESKNPATDEFDRENVHYMLLDREMAKKLIIELRRFVERK